jgi:hypothetical protein
MLPPMGAVVAWGGAVVAVAAYGRRRCYCSVAAYGRQRCYRRWAPLQHAIVGGATWLLAVTGGATIVGRRCCHIGEEVLPRNNGGATKVSAAEAML